MRDVIYKICDRLRGHSTEPEFFEVVSVYANNDGTYSVVVKPAERREEAEVERAKLEAYLKEKHLQEQGASNESNE